MDSKGWKDGKFDPDSQEPDYDFMFGNSPFPSSPETPVEKVNKISPAEKKALAKKTINGIFSFMESSNIELMADENGEFSFIRKNPLDKQPPA